MDGEVDGDTVGSNDVEVVGICDGTVDGTNDMDGVIVGVEDTVVGVCVTDGATVDFIFFLDFDFFFLEPFLLRFFDFFDFGTLVLGAFVYFGDGDDGDTVFLLDGAIGGFLSPSFFLSNGRSDPPPPAFAFAASEVVLVDVVVVAVPVDIPAHSFVHASISSRWSKSKSSQVIARPCNLFLANNSRLPVVLLLLLLLIRPLTLPLPVLPVPVLPIAALTPIIDEDETTTTRTRTTTSCSNSKLFN